MSGQTDLLMRPFLLIVVLFAAACAAPAPVIEPAPEPDPAPDPAARIQAVVLQEGSLAVLGSGGEAVDGPWTSVQRVLAGEPTFFSAMSADSTVLFAAGPSGVERIHSVAGPAVYTGAWAPDRQRAVIGHYAPRGEASQGRPAMGPGDILTWDGTGLTPVGCSASRAALAWHPDGSLLVRNTDTLYLVSTDECRTLRSVDARRMLGLTVSPDAAHLAFIHRELEYNRSTRAYEADSTFRLTALDGSDPRTIVSFRYNPKRLAWKPDGSELAFDVQATEEAGRAISIFEVTGGTTAFLHPPATDFDEYAPVWAPDGGGVAYYRGYDGAASSIFVRRFEIAQPSGIPETEGAQLIGWVGPRSVAFVGSDGILRVHDLQSRSTITLGPADQVASVRPIG